MESQLPKSSILRGHRSFARVLTRGKSITRAPIRCFYVVQVGGPESLRVGFAVSRDVRGAVHRTHLRRLMREAFRRQKQTVLGILGRSSTSTEIVLMYIGFADRNNRRPSYKEIEQRVLETFQAVAKAL